LSYFGAFAVFVDNMTVESSLVLILATLNLVGFLCTAEQR